MENEEFFKSFVLGYLKSKYPEILKEIEEAYKEVGKDVYL